MLIDHRFKVPPAAVIAASTTAIESNLAKHRKAS
jgi:hypothetical protein